jgi:tail tube protein
MAVPIHQVGHVDEVTYGTYVAPTRFTEFLSESVQNQIKRVESEGMRPGNRILRSYQWAPGGQAVDGDIEMEVGTKGFGLWWKHAFGAVATTQPDAGGNPTVYDHTFSPGDLVGKSLTVQVGRVASTGTVTPFTYTGCKVAKWVLSAEVDGLAHLVLTLMGQAESTAQSLASASYASGLALFPFTQGTLTIGGTATDVKSFSLSGDNGLNGERYRLGSATRKEPLEQQFRVYDGSLTAYFDDLTAYNRFVNGTEAALVLDFLGATISGIYKFELKVTANVRFDGETPSADGPTDVEQPLAFKVVDTGSSSISVLERTTDTTP